MSTINKIVVGIIKESDDKRVSMLPDTAAQLVKLGATVLIETGAGTGAFAPDEAYTSLGIETRPRDQIFKDSDILLSIHPIPNGEIPRIKRGAVYVSSFQPFADDSILKVLSGAGLTAFSLDMIPRITAAQSMDVLSSMASIAGYKAAVLAAAHLPKYFPMLTTAAGSVQPARVLVLGAGVAGLQAIATARRLGAMVEAFDTRAAVRQEVESLGARFVEVPGARDDKSAGGYAVEQTEEYKQRQRQMIHDHAVKSDVIITTALLRGKRAPLLVTADTVKAMRPGSVIVDLASASGGNCELTRPGETILVNGVTIIGANDLASTMPVHASQLYGRNLLNFLKLFVKQGNCQIDLQNDILGPSCVVWQGEVRYKRN
ncbi:MAG: Re/Si-specific NAD(P)(+) transhydrogenase subunit alpha [Verrucomicrobiae bacterium]|nr:Re/Si-specific NAD(P)(+) transhydrogenase subunit alpha [Verrucomicrobiae bacterium]